MFGDFVRPAPPLSLPAQRLAMTRAAIASNAGFSAKFEDSATAIFNWLTLAIGFRLRRSSRTHELWRPLNSGEARTHLNGADFSVGFPPLVPQPVEFFLPLSLRFVIQYFCACTLDYHVDDHGGM